MSSDPARQHCAVYQDELLRLTCGHTAALSPELEAHLASCPTCREELDTNLHMHAELAEALAPEPLPTNFTQRIRREIDQINHSRTPRHLSLWRWVNAAAAACLLATLVWPVNWQNKLTANNPAPQEQQIALTDEDAAVIVAAFTTLNWESTVEETVDHLATRVDDVSRRLQREASEDSILPWGPDDDWDLPSTDANTSRRAPAKEQLACSAQTLAVIGHS